MTKAREIMSGGAECASTSDSVAKTARKLRDLDVGALPICGEDNRLQGMISDRDIVLKCVAEGHDTEEMTVESYVSDKPVTIGADDSVDEALRTMSRAGVRRLPVIDGHDLVGMVTQADLARSLDDDRAGELVEAVSSSSAVD